MSNKNLHTNADLDRLHEASLVDERTLSMLHTQGVKLTACIDVREEQANGSIQWKRKPRDGKNSSTSVLTDPVATHRAEPQTTYKILLGQSKLVVIDIDDVKQEHATKVIEALRAAGVMRFNSKSGGMHFLLKSCRQADSVVELSKKGTPKPSTPLYTSGHGNCKTTFGDFLILDANLYRYIDGTLLKSISEIDGLYKLLKHKEYEDPEKIRALKVDRFVDLQIAHLDKHKHKGRNNVMSALLHYLKQNLYSMLGEEDPTALYDVATRLVNHYNEVYNPDDAGHFSDYDQRIEVDVFNPELVLVKKGLETMDMIDLAIKLVFNDYGDNVKIFSKGDKIDNLGVVVWDNIGARWIKRWLVVAGEEGSVGFIDEILQKYREIYSMSNKGCLLPPIAQDATNTACIKRRLGALAVFESKLGFDVLDVDKGFKFGRTLFKKLTKEGNYLYKVLQEDNGKLIEIDNKPEFMLLKCFGEVSEVESDMFDDFLADIFEDDMTKYTMMCDCIAQTFLGSKVRKLVVCEGGGDNGKSVLLKVLNNAFGELGGSAGKSAYTDYGKQAKEDKTVLKARQDLIGLRYAYIPDFNDCVINMGFVKTASSLEPVEVSSVFQNVEEATLYCKTFIGSNDLPELKATGRSVEKRFDLFEFKQSYGHAEGDKEPDEDKEKDLFADAPRIRRWIINRVQEFLNNEETVRVSKVVLEKTAEYVQSGKNGVVDMLEKFLVRTREAGKLPLGRSAGKNSSATGLMALVAHLAEQEGWKSAPTRSRMRRYLAKMEIKLTKDIYPFLHAQLNEEGMKHYRVACGETYENVFGVEPVISTTDITASPVKEVVVDEDNTSKEAPLPSSVIDNNVSEHIDLADRDFDPTSLLGMNEEARS